MFYQRFIIVVLLALAACNNQSKENLLQSGVELLQSGDTRGSIVYFKSALEKDPNFYEARYHLGDAYLKSGYLDRAETEFKKVSLQSPSFVDLPLKFAEIYLNTSRHDQVIQTLNEFHHHSAPTATSLDLQGRAYALSREQRKAEDAFLKAMALDPDDPSPKLNLAKTLIDQSRHEEAHELLLLLVEQHKQFNPGIELLASLELKRRKPSLAMNYYQLLYDLDPANVNALYMTGFIPLLSGKLDYSIKIAEKLSSEFPDDYRTNQLNGLIAYRKGLFEEALVGLLESIKVYKQPLTYYFLGLSYFRLGDYELSINQFQKVLDAQPDLPQARLMLATTFLQQGRVDECLGAVRYVLEKDDKNSFAYNIMGSAQLMNRNFDEAMQAFDRAIKIDPGFVDVYIKKGQSYLSQGEPDLAEAALRDAISLSPQVLNARLMLARLNIQQENYDEAVETLQNGLAGTPEDALIYNYLAEIAFKQKKDQEAVKNLQKAKAAFPEYSSPVLRLASYHLAKSDYDSAIAEYRSVLEKVPGNLQALVGLGLAYELAGKIKLAESIYEQMLKSDRPESILHVAQYYLKSKRNEEALAMVEGALAKSPSYVPLYEIKSTILLQSGKIDEALSVLEVVEKLEIGRGYPKIISTLLKHGKDSQAVKVAERVTSNLPGINYGYLLQASIFEYKRQLKKAEDIVRQGLSVIHGDPGLTLQLGHIHEVTKNTSAATRVYQGLIQKNPDYYPAFFALGAMYERLGNKKVALNYYQQTISLNDRFVPALNNLSYLYADSNENLEEALALALKAYRLAPGQQDIMDTLGYALLKNGKVSEAVKILEKANKTHVYNPSVSFHLALAYAELRQTEKAIAELEKSLAFGDFPEAERCRSLLEKLKT